MNADRRQVGKIVIALLNEGAATGEIGDDSHEVLGETLAHLQRQEYHQLRAQGKFEGKNASTDKQIAICRVALPALEEAVAAYNSDDWETVVKRVTLAVETDGSAPPKERKQREDRRGRSQVRKSKA